MKKRLFIFGTIICLLLTACSKNHNDAIAPPPKMTITSFNPTHGYAGDTIIIAGTNFSASDSIYFNGTDVKKIISATSEQLKVIVPDGAASGNIRVVHEKSTAVSDSAFVVDHRVYVCGNEYVYGKACYWVNDSQVVFANAEASPTSSIYVAGKDVYVSGVHNYLAVYWKNGVPVDLTTDITKTAQPNSIFVSGSDVYVAGYEPAYNYVATYWKNGTAVHLTDGLASSSYANSIYVSANGDIYVAGLEGDGRAVYWKNGTEVVLPGNSGFPGATSIYVSGNDVFVAGNDSRVARYWKNGVLVDLTSTDSCVGMATSIYVSGNDVYVAGNEYSNFDGKMRATYWKNGKAVYLNDGSEYAIANSIFVLGSDVYVAGQIDYYTPAYWINGTTVLLPNGSNATGIFVQ